VFPVLRIIYGGKGIFADFSSFLFLSLLPPVTRVLTSSEKNSAPFFESFMMRPMDRCGEVKATPGFCQGSLRAIAQQAVVEFLMGGLGCCVVWTSHQIAQRYEMLRI
jgi:hypothetical protein